VFGSIVRLRNYVAHPEGHMVDMPPSVFRFLRDVAEIINRLWGHDTEGGRLFPKPIPRWARVAALSPDRCAAVTFGSLAQLRIESDHRDWTYAVFLAAAEEDLVAFDSQSPGHQRFAYVPGFQMTNYPVQLLWGPGSWDDLIQVIDRFSDEAPVDQVTFLDRTFYVRRTSDGAVEYPRDRSDVLGALESPPRRLPSRCLRGRTRSPQRLRRYRRQHHAHHALDRRRSCAPTRRNIGTDVSQCPPIQLSRMSQAMLSGPAIPAF
jgi:hypothetical protein